MFNCRKILSKQFFHEPKDAGLLHIVQELEPAVQQALKKSAKFNAISLYRKIASIVNFVVDRKEADEEKGELDLRNKLFPHKIPVIHANLKFRESTWKGTESQFVYDAYQKQLRAKL